MTGQFADQPAHWPVITSAERYRGKIINVRTDTVRVPEGTSTEREVVEHPGAVGIVALDDQYRVLMIRQYRHAVGRLLWELPAGYQARDWHVLADYFSSPGITTERLRIFLARGLAEVPQADRTFVPVNEEAHLVLDWVPLDRAVALVLAGEIHNGVAAVGLLAAQVARQDNFGGLRDQDAPEQ